ncbi:MAG: helix-hairpin-helix domain-containing protein [Candidatus Omnitrophica bacterium]|nr:helix-hairpin-helix domain-containing protein [Candidatus Omnitrophota bacterium]
MKNSIKRYSYLLPNRGSILIVTMWVLICFSILSIGLYRVVSSRIKVTEVMTHRIIGQYLAKAACAYFKVIRKTDKTPYDTLTELSTPEEQELGRGKFKYILKDEESKININKASVDMISRLPGFSKDTAKNVFESKLKPFKAIEQLLLIDGVDEGILDKCKGLITVYGNGSVNINTASPEVFKALGIDEGLVSIIMDLRRGPDGKEGTADDVAFENKDRIMEDLRSKTSLYEEQQAKLLQLTSQNMLSVISDTFTLDIETTVLEKPAMRYNIVMEKGKIKRWTEI